MRNVQLLEEKVANDMCEEVVSNIPATIYDRISTLEYKLSVVRRYAESVDKQVCDNLERIDKLNHRLCETQRRLDSIESQLQTHRRFVADMCGIAVIFMVLICILVGYLLWRTAWL